MTYLEQVQHDIEQYEAKLLDQYAGQALSGILAGSAGRIDHPDSVAQSAWQQAKAMMSRRKWVLSQPTESSST